MNRSNRFVNRVVENSIRADIINLSWKRTYCLRPNSWSIFKSVGRPSLNFSKITNSHISGLAECFSSERRTSTSSSRPTSLNNPGRVRKAGFLRRLSHRGINHGECRPAEPGGAKISPSPPHLVVPSSVWRPSLFNGAPDNIAVFIPQRQTRAVFHNGRRGAGLAGIATPVSGQADRVTRLLGFTPIIQGPVQGHAEAPGLAIEDLHEGQLHRAETPHGLTGEFAHEDTDRHKHEKEEI